MTRDSLSSSRSAVYQQLKEIVGTGRIAPDPAISEQSSSKDNTFMNLGVSRAKADALDDRVADLIIITALNEELEAVKSVLLKDCEKREIEVNGLFVNYGTIDLSGRSLRLAIYSLSEMGMVPAAALVTRLAMIIRPKLVIMSGICAGHEGKTNIGDVVVASDVFNYDSVKRRADGNLADYPHVALSAPLSSIVNSIISSEGIERVLESEWRSARNRPDTRIKVKLAPLATGSAVVADRAVFKEITQHQRRALAIDMESFGIARAVTYLEGVSWLVVKAVSDFANDEKAISEGSGEMRSFDVFREYCCTMAAAFIKEFLSKALRSDSMKHLGKYAGSG